MFYVYWLICWIILNKILGWLASWNWYFPSSNATNFQNIVFFIQITFWSAIVALILTIIF
jgi:hypothetical protein